MDERPESVIITGASGRLGASVARRLDGRYRVVAFDRAGPPVPPEGIETVDIDLASESGVRSAFREFRDRHGPEVASVLHFAAYYDFSGEPDPRYEEINVNGTARLLRGLAEAGVRAGQFVYASSMVVHRPGERGRRIAEGSPLGPTMPYSVSKLRGEEALRDARGETPLVVLRLANVYDDRVHHPVLAQQVRRIFERRPGAWFFPADPAAAQSYLHRDDLLDAVERVVDRRSSLPPELTLLLGEPGGVPYGEIQRELGRLLRGVSLRTYRVPAFLARAGVRALRLWPWGKDDFVRPWMIDRAGDHYELDVALARERLGWAPRRSLLETLPVIAASVLEDPGRWYRENGLQAPRSLQRPYPAAASPNATPR